MMLSSSNSTLIPFTEFFLHCFRGAWTWWKGLLSALLTIMLIVASVANLTLMRVIQSEQHLHNPMYFFMCLLSLVDLTVCWLAATPVLNSLWFSSETITPPSCFVQLFFIHALTSIQSGVFMIMSYDRYNAICNPLQYPVITSNNYFLKASIVVIGRSTIVSVPMVALTAQLNYCTKTVIPQCYCETLSLSSLACDPNPVIGIYCFIAVWFTTGFDVVLIVFSYFMILRAVLELRSQGALSKAFSTCSSHLILIVYFYSSEIVLMIAGAMKDKLSVDINALLAVLFCFIPPVLNPLVYGVRTKKIRERIIWNLRNIFLQKI